MIFWSVDDLEGLHGNLEGMSECPRDVLLGDEALLQKIFNNLYGVETVATPGVMFWDIGHYLKEPVCLQWHHEVLDLGIIEVHEIV